MSLSPSLAAILVSIVGAFVLAVVNSERAAFLVNRFPRTSYRRCPHPSCYLLLPISVAVHHPQVVPHSTALSLAFPSSFLLPPPLLVELAKLPPRVHAFQHAGEGSHTRCRHCVVAAIIRVRIFAVTPLLYDVRNPPGGSYALLPVYLSFYTLILSFYLCSCCAYSRAGCYHMWCPTFFLTFCPGIHGTVFSLATLSRQSPPTPTHHAHTLPIYV